MLLKWITLKQDGCVLIDEKSAEYYSNKAIYIEYSRYNNRLNILSVIFLLIFNLYNIECSSSLSKL